MAINNLCMKNLFLSLIILIGAASNCILAFAEESKFQLQLNQQGIDQKKVEQIKQFILEVENLLPQKMKDVINRKITVSFDLEDNRKELSLPLCEKIDGDISDISENHYGRLPWYSILTPNNLDKISLNELFIQEIIRGANGTRTYNCKHKTMYKLAQASLIHEVSHIYDLSDTLTPEQKKTKMFCVRNRDKITRAKIKARREYNKKYKICEEIKDLDYAVSTRRNFRNLFNWSIQGLLYIKGTVQKNTISNRIPDVYEFEAPAESFAVNMEYFILDSEYACRLPARNQFLEEHFKQSFEKDRVCAMNSKIFLNSQNFFENFDHIVDLDPKRIYQIHYLFASKGDTVISRWGHAMYRFILCAPTRKNVGPECLDDIEHHVVLSYRANVGDLAINKLKGLMGGYPSYGFLFRFLDIQEEYNKTELRDLISLPLKISENQKQLFIYQTLERYWNYLGTYYFLSNNCATEAQHVLKGVVGDYEVQKIDPMTPLGLFDDLDKINLIDVDLLQNEKLAQKNGYFWASNRNLMDYSFSIIATVDDTYDEVEEFMETTAQERKDFYDMLVKANPEKKGKIAAAFYVIEDFVFLRLANKIKDELLETYIEISEKVEDQNSGSNNVSTLSSLEEVIVKLGGLYSSDIILDKGYGVPLSIERNPEVWEKVLKFRSVLGTPEDFSDLLVGLVKQEIPEKNGIVNNRKYFHKEFLLSISQ